MRAAAGKDGKAEPGAQMNGWLLPEQAVIGGREYALHADFRDILEIFRYLEDPEKPEFLRWRIAVGLFYEGDIPEEHMGEAMEYLAQFISCGSRGKPGPKLLDWEQDAQVIVADVNRAAGREVRQMEFLHWWSFLAFFNAVGEGQLSTLVSIRDKLRRGKKLEPWEREYYRRNKDRVDLKKRYSPEEEQQRRLLEERLG